MTTKDKAEKERILDLLVATDAGTHLMHEGFDVDNPENYTREWFSWANMMFCELVMDYFDIRVENRRKSNDKEKSILFPIVIGIVNGICLMKNIICA